MDDLKSIPFEVGSPFVSMGVLTSVPIVMYWKICDLESQYFPVAFRILALIPVSSHYTLGHPIIFSSLYGHMALPFGESRFIGLN